MSYHENVSKHHAFVVCFQLCSLLCFGCAHCFSSLDDIKFSIKGDKIMPQSFFVKLHKCLLNKLAIILHY